MAEPLEGQAATPAKTRRLLTPREVGEILRIGTSTVYRLAETKVLPSVGLPGAHVLRIPSDRLDVLIQRWTREGFTPQRRNYPKQRKLHGKDADTFTPASAQESPR